MAVYILIVIISIITTFIVLKYNLHEHNVDETLRNLIELTYSNLTAH